MFERSQNPFQPAPLERGVKPVLQVLNDSRHALLAQWGRIRPAYHRVIESPSPQSSQEVSEDLEILKAAEHLKIRLRENAKAFNWNLIGMGELPDSGINEILLNEAADMGNEYETKGLDYLIEGLHPRERIIDRFNADQMDRLEKYGGWRPTYFFTREQLQKVIQQRREAMVREYNERRRLDGSPHTQNTDYMGRRGWDEMTHQSDRAQWEGGFE